MSSIDGMTSKLHHTAEVLGRMVSTHREVQPIHNATSCRRPSTTAQGRTSCCRKSSSTLNGALRQSGLLWLLVLTVGLLNTNLAVAQNETVTVFLDTDSPPAFNARECFAMFDTLDQVQYICREHPDMVPLLLYAESMAKDECEKQFQNEMWNCSDFSLLKTPKINRGSDVFREGAYVDAISFAAIAHTVAKACKENLLRSCTCDTSVPETDENSSVQYETSCSDNTEYGLQVAEKFLNKRHTSVGRDLKHELTQHNYRAAKQAIKGIIDNTPPTCSCHGVSGSCTVQSCHSKLPEFEVLGSELKKKYNDACEVAANGRSDNAWISECGREYTNKDLIFRDKYNWCVADSSIGARGVLGRRCDPNTTGSGSCTNLCRKCNRRPQQQEETYSYQCSCSFHFCCSIHCQICTGEREFYTCA